MQVACCAASPGGRPARRVVRARRASPSRRPLPPTRGTRREGAGPRDRPWPPGATERDPRSAPPRPTHAQPRPECGRVAPLAEMLTKGFFDHDSGDGQVFWKRIQAFYPEGRFGYWSVGENLFWTTGSCERHREHEGLDGEPGAPREHPRSGLAPDRDLVDHLHRRPGDLRQHRRHRDHHGLRRPPIARTSRKNAPSTVALSSTASTDLRLGPCGLRLEPLEAASTYLRSVLGAGGTLARPAGGARAREVEMMLGSAKKPARRLPAGSRGNFLPCSKLPGADSPGSIRLTRGPAYARGDDDASDL